MEYFDVTAVAVAGKIVCMKKVLILSNTCWNAFHYRKSLNKGLQKAGYQVQVLAGLDGYEKSLHEQNIPVTGLYISAKGLNPFQDFQTFKEIFNYLRREKPDVVFSFTIKPVLYAGLAAGLLQIFNAFQKDSRRLKIIPTLTGLGTVFIKSNWVTRLVRLLYWFSLKSSTCVFFQNADDRDLFLKLKLISQVKIEIVPGSGIDPNEFSPDFAKGNRAASTMDSKLGPKNDLVFLLIARMLWDKGILEYYEAAKAIKKVYPFCHFQLLGPTGVENRTAIPVATIQYWVNEGIIEYLPETADVRPFIAESDVVVLPSYREGLPKSLLEAACMGKPLIATDVPGCRDLLANENGFLCQEKSSKSLEKAIESMIHLTKEARLQMGINSRELVLQGFTESIVVQKYLNRIY